MSTSHTSKRRRSWAKVFEASAIWAIVAAVMGWLIYKEVSRKTLEIEQTKAGRKLIIEAEELHGIAERSSLVCQGLTVGKVTEIIATPSEQNPGTLTLSIHAQLDALYSGWTFSDQANVAKGGVMSGLTGTNVTLTYTGELSEEEAVVDFSETEPQRISLKAPEDTAARIKALLTDTETIIGAFTKEVTPPEGWPEGEKATRIDVLSANLSAASEAINGAAEKLEHQMDAESEESLMAGMRDIENELKSFTENSNMLITDVRETVASIETRFDDALGGTTAERARLRKEAEELLSSLDTFVDRLDDLASRTGDTFLGRRIIRKPSDGESEETSPSPESERNRPIRRAGPR